MKAETSHQKTGSRKSLPEVILYRSKIAVFQTQRLTKWALHPSQWKKLELAGPEEGFPYLIYNKVFPIIRHETDTHPLLEEGKRVNLALAAPSFDGLLLTPDDPFSFWRNLGRVSEARGYRHGMELRSGCVVPTIGGGLCLLSNALFEMAAQLGWTILERHGHTMEVGSPPPGSLRGLDATLFWPHVDLRFAPTQGKARLEVKVIGDRLVLKVRANVPLTIQTHFSNEKENEERGTQGLIRHGRVVRKVFAESGEMIREEVVAENRKRVVESNEKRENCLTCGENHCAERTLSLKDLP